MKVASLADVKAHFSAFVKASADGPVIVTRNGKAVAVLLGVEDEDELERLVLGYSRQLRRILDAGREAIRATGGIPHEQFWEQVEGRATSLRQRKSAKRKNGLLKQRQLGRR